jgi:hypothetical protein
MGAASIGQPMHHAHKQSAWEFEETFLRGFHRRLAS